MKSIYIGLLLLAVFLWSFSVQKEPVKKTERLSFTSQEATEKLLSLEIYGEKGGGVEVRLNDIPACQLTLNKGTGYGNAVTQAKYYAKPGVNTISVYPLSETGKTTVRMAYYQKGDVTGLDHGETIIEIVMENEQSPIHKEVKLPADSIKWPWIDTDMITDEKSKKEAIGFCKSFYKIMAENNIEGMISAADPILTYELMSKPKTIKEDLVEEWKKGLKQAFDGKNIFDDINTLSIQLKPIANGKLFEVEREDGSFLFRASDNNEFVVGFKSIIGRKDGVWKFYH